MRARNLAALIATLLFCSTAFAQAWPSRPIRLVVPFAPGGSSDILGRSVARYLGEQMNAQFVVDNRGGAGGHVGAEHVARSAPDGYTVLFGTIGTHGIGPAMYRKLPYDPLNDLTPVSLMHRLPNILIVNDALPVRSVKDLIDYAKANPGKLTFASAGNGSTAHLFAELFKMSTGVNMVHVPYKGGGAAMPDLMSGQVSLMFETSSSALAAAKSGRIRPLAVTSRSRWPTAKDLPTIAESGVPDFVVESWDGMVAPTGTPRPVIDRLSAELARLAKNPAYQQAMLEIGTEAVSSTPEEFGAFMRTEVARWRKAIEASGAKVD